MATEEQKEVDVCQAQERPKEQIVDPWKAVAAEGKDTIDYDKLIGRTTLRHSVQIFSFLLFSSDMQNSLEAKESKEVCWTESNK